MLNSEQRRQLFLALINADPTLPNVLNSERRRQLYAVLVAIDPALVQPLLDSCSAVRGIINEQPLSRQPKEKAKEVIKENVRPPVRKHNTSHTQIESVLNQDSVDEMTDHTRDSDTSTLVTNAQKEINQAKKKKIAGTKTKKHALPLPKKNARRLVQKYTNHIDIESMSNQEDTHEMTNQTKDSVTSNLEYNIPREDHNIENTDQDST
ncbi:13493_t:CDS:2, partial [Racocetra fulgida]